MKKLFIILFRVGFITTFFIDQCNKSDAIKTQTLKEWFISRYGVDTILTDGTVITDSMILENVEKLELDSTVRIISEQ